MPFRQRNSSLSRLHRRLAEATLPAATSLASTLLFWRSLIADTAEAHTLPREVASGRFRQPATQNARNLKINEHSMAACVSMMDARR
jgi:hypothetical protein